MSRRIELRERESREMSFAVIYALVVRVYRTAVGRKYANAQAGLVLKIRKNDE